MDLRDRLLEALNRNPEYRAIMPAQPTYQLAKAARVPCKVAREELHSMEVDGLVVRYLPWCSQNNLFWQVLDKP